MLEMLLFVTRIHRLKLNWSKLRYLDIGYPDKVTSYCIVKNLSCIVGFAVAYGCESLAISKTTKDRLMAFKMWFCGGCYRYHGPKSKSVSRLLRAAGVQCTLMNTIRQRQLDFFGHAIRKHSLEHLVVTDW